MRATRRTPPPVCTGAGTIAIDLQGMTTCTTLPPDGLCGICQQRVKVDWFQRCVTHPFVDPDPRPRRTAVSTPSQNVKAFPSVSVMKGA